MTRRGFLIALSVCLLVASTARADMAPPPTFVVDFLWLGIPVGLFAGAALITGVVVLFRGLRKQGVNRFLSVAICLVLLGGVNFLFYMYALRKSDEARANRKTFGLPPAATDRNETR
jgi:hypothetical protein